VKSGYHTDIEMLREKTHYSLEDYGLWMLQAWWPIECLVRQWEHCPN